MKVYVSITSIYDKQHELLLTLKSIASQTRKPDTCFIYLSEHPYLLDKGFPRKQLHKDLQDFLNKNASLFVIKWTDNIGPYRKLLPLLKEKWNEDCLIITLDDDTEYNKSLVSDYVIDWTTHKCCIAYRGFTFNVGTPPSSLQSITYENRKKLVNKYLFNFHTGKGGVVYHPSFFKRTGDLIFNRAVYRECCETGDDIWFNFIRIANNVDCFVKNYQYMTKDYSSPFSLYDNFNMKNKLNTVNIQKTINCLLAMNVLKSGLSFDSNTYWENRYKNTGTSGDGSYGLKAEFKGQFLSQFITDKAIKTIIDYGVGDGNQLKYIKTQNTSYIGLDVSPTAIATCQRMFADDTNKQFIEVKNFDWAQKGELVISSDVIFHLIDDSIYHQYMKNLFELSTKYVIIHAVDNDFVTAQHARFRKFTPYIKNNFPSWRLVNFVHNHLWTGPNSSQMGFYVYQKF